MIHVDLQMNLLEGLAAGHDRYCGNGLITRQSRASFCSSSVSPNQSIRLFDGVFMPKSLHLCCRFAGIKVAVLAFQQTMPQLIVGLLDSRCTTGIGFCNLLKLLLDRAGRHAPKAGGDIGALTALLDVVLTRVHAALLRDAVLMLTVLDKNTDL